MMDWTSHWEKYAPGYSREVEQATAAVDKAEENLLAALRAAYPIGARVRVVHHRGEFMGVVSGYDTYGSRVRVMNCRSGKTAKWWAAHVELVGSSNAEAGQ